METIYYTTSPSTFILTMPNSSMLFFPSLIHLLYCRPSGGRLVALSGLIFFPGNYNREKGGRELKAFVKEILSDWTTLSKLYNK